MGDDFDEMGPIDYLVVEFPGNRMTGKALPLLVDLVDRGLIRILDLVFVRKELDGSVSGLAVTDLDGDGELDPAVFQGASSGLLAPDDVAEAAAVLEPGSSAGILVYENVWAAPFAAELRRSGGQLVASGRIPVQALLAALEAADAEPSPRRHRRPSAERGRDHARSSPGSRAHGGRRRHRHRRVQPRLAATGRPVGPEGPAGTAGAGARSTPRQPPAPRPAADEMDAKLAQLKQLGELKEQGVLSEASSPRRRPGSSAPDQSGPAGPAGLGCAPTTSRARRLSSRASTAPITVAQTSTNDDDEQPADVGERDPERAELPGGADQRTRQVDPARRRGAGHPDAHEHPAGQQPPPGHLAGEQQPRHPGPQQAGRAARCAPARPASRTPRRWRAGGARSDARRSNSSTPNRAATHRHPPVQPGGRTPHTLPYIRASAREKLVALTTAMRTPRMPKAPRVSGVRGHACSRTCARAVGQRQARRRRRRPPRRCCPGQQRRHRDDEREHAGERLRGQRHRPVERLDVAAAPPTALVTTRTTGGGALRRASSTAARARGPRARDALRGVGGLIGTGGRPSGRVVSAGHCDRRWTRPPVPPHPGRGRGGEPPAVPSVQPVTNHPAGRTGRGRVPGRPCPSRRRRCPGPCWCCSGPRRPSSSSARDALGRRRWSRRSCSRSS